MKRQGLVAAAVLLAVGIVVALLLQRGHGPASGAGTTAPAGERIFVDDSLGVRLRLPDSPGWTLRREPAGLPDGRVVTALHERDDATVRLVILPAGVDTKVDDVFEARKRQLAPAFSVDKLDKAIAKVIRDETREVGGKTFRQWQAQTQPIKVPGEPAAQVVFLWLMTVQPPHSVECLGTVRFPAQRSPEEQAVSEALLHDVIYILQSLEVR